MSSCVCECVCVFVCVCVCGCGGVWQLEAALGYPAFYALMHQAAKDAPPGEAGASLTRIPVSASLTRIPLPDSDTRQRAS